MGKIVSSVRAKTAVVTIANESRRNAMTLEMWRQLAQVIREFEDCNDVVATVIRGAGHSAFSAGADISELSTLRYGAAATSAYDEAIAVAEDCISTSGKATIAMMWGICAGGGAAIALACDLRFAASDLRVAIPSARLGAVYPSRTVRRLVQVVGASAAFDLLASGRTVEAPEALSMRLVDRVVQSADLEKVVLDYTARVGDNAALSVRAAKLAVRLALDPTDGALRDVLHRLESMAAASGDYLEGITAFLDKRTARFRS